jgi:foldase protein PrsA
VNLTIGLGTAVAAAVAMAAVLLPACASKPVAVGPDRVVVQHILVSFSGRVPGKIIHRKQAEAAALAAEVLGRARKGEDFDALVKEYTDDQYPGRYTLVNTGRSPAAGEYGRDQMVTGFGDTAFSLAVGAVGMCSFDNGRSPYGWHIIKRIE